MIIVSPNLMLLEIYIIKYQEEIKIAKAKMSLSRSVGAHGFFATGRKREFEIL